VLVQGAPPSADSPVVIIPRTVIDRELADARMLGNQVQIVPGPRGGFRLVGIAPGSFCDRVGLRTGDIVWRVDGRILNSVDDALRAVAWLRITDHFTVDLMRGQRPMAYRYVITGPATASR
jgi:S1-C subfamily serine protease